MTKTQNDKTTSIPKMTNRFHHYLVAGEVIFTLPTGEISRMPLNAMILTDTQKLGERQLGKAQQALQMHFFQKTENDKGLVVIDVMLLNFCHLGYMTSHEFAKPPEGMEKQEIAKPELKDVN